MTTHMDSHGTGSVQYDRWNEDNINMNVEGSQSTMMRWDELTADKKMQGSNIMFLFSLKKGLMLLWI